MLIFLVLATLDIWIFSNASRWKLDQLYRWLDRLNGYNDKKGEASESGLDQINIKILEWKEEGSEYYNKIPLKLRQIQSVNFQLCDTALEYQLELIVNDNGRRKTPAQRYTDFFGKLQYNLCLQDMEFKRAQYAVGQLDKSKWLAWYDAWASDQSISNDMKIPAEKLANYLKRYVSQIDVGSPDEQIAKVDQEIRAMIKEICPYVTAEKLAGIVNSANIEYFEKTRANIGADLEPFIWSSSKGVCSNKKLQEEFVKSVGNHLLTQLNSIKMKDQNLADISDAKLISDILFPANGKQPDQLLRVGNPIELMKRLVELTDDKQQEEVKKLLDMQKINSDYRICNFKYISERDKLAKTYLDNQILGMYVKSINALQYHVCDRKTRYNAAKVAHEVPLYQIGRVEELAGLILKYQARRGKTNGLFIDPRVGYGKAVGDLAYRYTLMDYFASAEYESKKNQNKQLASARQTYNNLLHKTCSNVRTQISMEDLNFITDLLKFEPNEKLGELTISLYDYAIICNFDDNWGLAEALKQLKVSSSY